VCACIDDTDGSLLYGFNLVCLRFSNQVMPDGSCIVTKFMDITAMFLSRDSLYYYYLLFRHLMRWPMCQNVADCSAIVHRDYIPKPAAIVDHFAGSGARRLRFVFQDKNGWKHKTMSGWGDDNYDIVTRINVSLFFQSSGHTPNWDTPNGCGVHCSSTDVFVLRNGI